jgi:hypothetical protein
MNWLQRLERLERKHRRLTIRRNVRAYRERQKEAGVRRLDVALDAQRYLQLRKMMAPGETISATVERLLDAVSGNPKLGLDH